MDFKKAIKELEKMESAEFRERVSKMTDKQLDAEIKKYFKKRVSRK